MCTQMRQAAAMRVTDCHNIDDFREPASRSPCLGSRNDVR
jgi:hypothetical protein